MSESKYYWKCFRCGHIVISESEPDEICQECGNLLEAVDE